MATSPPTLLHQLSEALREIRLIVSDRRLRTVSGGEYEADEKILALTKDALALLTPEVLAREERERAVIEAARAWAYCDRVASMYEHGEAYEAQDADADANDAEENLFSACRSLAALDADPKGSSPPTKETDHA